IDTRDNRAITRSGWEVNVRSGIANQVDGDEFKYWNLQADIRRHIHMFYDRRLILRLAAERVRPLSGKDIPFFDLSELGRRETIRGFPRGRFRDRDMLMASIEYRYPIWHYFDWILFVDGGQVSPDILNDVDLNDFSFTYGSGFLIRGNEDPVLHISVGVSKDQVRFYVVLD
ncbi:MAG: BamA/TamA family outer membrane protein, partial [bacterium]